MPIRATTAKFNFVTQLSESLLDQTLKFLYNAKAFPTWFNGEHREESQSLGITVTLKYTLGLREPTLFLDTSTEGGIGVKLDMEAVFALSIEIAPRTDEPGGSFEYSANCHASGKLIGNLLIAKEGDETDLRISFADLINVELDVRDHDIPQNYLTLLAHLTRRALMIDLRTRVVAVPITTGFNHLTMGGWAVQPAVVRIMDDRDGDDRDNVTIAFNTWPNRGRGRARELVDWVGQHNRFGVAIDQRLFTQFLDRAWLDNLLPRRFSLQGTPDPSPLYSSRREDVVANVA